MIDGLDNRHMHARMNLLCGPVMMITFVMTLIDVRGKQLNIP